MPIKAPNAAAGTIDLSATYDVVMKAPAIMIIADHAPAAHTLRLSISIKYIAQHTSANIIANINFEPFTGPEKYYLPRIFLPEQVAAKADAVRKTMIDWYSNPENYPNGIVPKRSEIVDRVDSEMMGMMKLGTMPGSSGSRPSFTRSRSIDIPNEVFADLGVIDMDVSNIMQFYARHAGMGLECCRQNPTH